MAAIGGSLEEITIDGRTFPATADADVTRFLGGYVNDVQANGDLTARIIKTATPPSFTGINVECDDSRGDQEFLQGISNRDAFVVVALTLASGAVYQGRAMITGDMTYSTQNATVALDLMGEGTFTKQ